MSNQLSPEDVYELSKSFHDLSCTVGNFRYSNWHNLTQEQRTDLEAKQWTLFNTSSDLNAQSVVLKIKLLDSDLAILKTCTTAMQESEEKIKSVKKAISVATKAVAFGGSLYLAASTGNVAVMISAAASLNDELKEGNQD